MKYDGVKILPSCTFMSNLNKIESIEVTYNYKGGDYLCSKETFIPEYTSSYYDEWDVIYDGETEEGSKNDVNNKSDDESDRPVVEDSAQSLIIGILILMVIMLI